MDSDRYTVTYGRRIAAPAVERGRDTDATTTFIVDPSDGGAKVTITSELPLKAGIAGKIERYFSTRFLLRLYKEEIGKLEAVARDTLG